MKKKLGLISLTLMSVQLSASQPESETAWDIAKSILKRPYIAETPAQSKTEIVKKLTLFPKAAALSYGLIKSLSYTPLLSDPVRAKEVLSHAMGYLLVGMLIRAYNETQAYRKAQAEKAIGGTHENNQTN